jgi:hypothetical protein
LDLETLVDPVVITVEYDCAKIAGSPLLSALLYELKKVLAIFVVS